MFSVPDGLTGDPVKIRGYYCEPQDGRKHPVILHFYGYDTAGSKAKCECPYGNASSNAEFYLSHRGQYLNNRPASTGNPGVTEDCINIYNSDWFCYNFGDKDGYYYRGAFMDVVQAVRFMATRETSDMTKLFAEGSSQGGALTYAAAALSDYPFTAIAANVAFLGDFADGINIGGLAAEKSKVSKGSMSKEEMLAFLSYFDTKNLATRISCAVLASSGLQDGVCPPRTNVVPFNNLATPKQDKQYIFGPEMGHDYPKDWYSAMNKLFKDRM
jgi:cephalosporin-C deacetylase